MDELDSPSGRGLSFVDWADVAERAAADLDAWTERGASHLIDDAGMRQILIAALLDSGVHPGEMTLDARVDGARIDLWLDLESGITHAITIVRPRPDQQPRHAAGVVWRALNTTARHVAHEHLVVALLHDRAHQHLIGSLAAAGSNWPAAGHEQELGVDVITSAAGAAMGRAWRHAAIACLADHVSAGQHLLVLHTTPRTPPTPTVEMQTPLLWWTR